MPARHAAMPHRLGDDGARHPDPVDPTHRRARVARPSEQGVGPAVGVGLIRPGCGLEIWMGHDLGVPGLAFRGAAPASTPSCRCAGHP